jgi:hypothetical protein
MEVSGQLHTPAALPSRGRAPDTHWIGGWVGTRASLDTVTRKIPSLLAGLEPPIIQPVAQRYTTELYRLVKKIRHCLWRELSSGRPARSLVSIPTELPIGE